jgi:hypothetical protein
VISKIIIGSNKAFIPCCKYVCSNEQRAEILDSSFVRTTNFIEMAHDFQMLVSQRPSRTEGVLFHGILSFVPGESISDELAIKIANEYLMKLGFGESGWVITKHNDRKHSHLHILASLIDKNGKTINDSFIGLRGKKVAQALTLKYHLKPAIRKDLSKTNIDSLHKYDKRRYELYNIVNISLKQASSFKEFESFLFQYGVQIQLKSKRGDNTVIQGISFRYKDFSYKGSSIDRNFSFRNISKCFQSENLNHKDNYHTISSASEPRLPISSYVGIIFQSLYDTYTPKAFEKRIDHESEEDKRRKKRKQLSK